MTEHARRLGLLAAPFAGSVALAVALAGLASADPLIPQPPLPAPQPVGLAAAAPAALPAAPAAVPAAAPVPTITPATSQSIGDFLKAKGVGMEPQKADGFKALNIVLPMPQGWTHVPDPNVPDAFAVLADRMGGDGLYTSNAALVVYKLAGDFDPKEAISHGFIDSQSQTAWRATDGSLADFNGMPSSVIEGTYRQNNMTLNAARRHVIATVGPDRYLVTLTVTTSAQVSVAAGDATDAILRGYSVSVPGAAPPAPAAPAPAPTAPAPVAAPIAHAPAAIPASTPVNQLLTLPR